MSAPGNGQASMSVSHAGLGLIPFTLHEIEVVESSPAIEEECFVAVNNSLPASHANSAPGCRVGWKFMPASARVVQIEVVEIIIPWSKMRLLTGDDVEPT